MKRIIVPVLLFGVTFGLFSQETLVSDTERYYDFLALRGLTARPYLNYRTLSDSAWKIDEGTNHPWQDNKLFSRYTLHENIFLRLYGPELFTSFNTAFPYGQNDGALWQGKGFNMSVSAGVRFEGYGFELTFKPQFVFSQNLKFGIINSNYYDSPYGYVWGYHHNAGIDAPQRFGDRAFFEYDWGDSEIRYTWKTLTAGFGTQAIWLGPAYLNPILHSNNAPSYPKFDIGIRRQSVTIPWIDWYAGDIEARLWIGRLSESDYFDNDPSNNLVMFHGLAMAYAPSFLPGLTLSVNRVNMVPWTWGNLKHVIPSSENANEDQKASFGLSYILPQAGFEVYGEFAVDDYFSGGIEGYLTYPIHAFVYYAGFKKTLDIVPRKKIYGEIIFEFNWFEMSQNFQFAWPYSFYFHYQMHGYTNRGQLLGNASSPGGNSQYLRFVLFYPKGNFSIFISRNNPDNNYVYKDAVNSITMLTAFKANCNFGMDASYFLLPSLKISAGCIYNYIINPYFGQQVVSGTDSRHNFSLIFGLNWTF
ncbi:MAG: capsule assembly Wzi family protein [Treponema sp.]|jgi:hypothetical protein|nr:capsule assembly Wzi family protein [Treponema sp.]